MKNLSFIKKLFIAIATLNVVMYGVYGFLIWDINTKNQAASELMVQAGANMKKDEALRAIKLSLSENKDFLSQIDSFFVAPDGVVAFITILESLGKDSNVKLDIGAVAIESDKQDPHPFSENLTLKLSMSGSWQNISYFLSKLQNLPYRVGITSATVTLEGAADSTKFTATSTRVQANGEVWKGTFDIKVLKLK